MYTALTIAGSDSSGGAGIQADIKTMTANGVYAMSAITALTAQNTTGVAGILEVTPDFLKQQIDMIFDDIRPLRILRCVYVLSQRDGNGTLIFRIIEVGQTFDQPVHPGHRHQIPVFGKILRNPRQLCPVRVITIRVADADGIIFHVKRQRACVSCFLIFGMNGCRQKDA